jgi:hypothetical protein
VGEREREMSDGEYAESEARQRLGQRARGVVSCVREQEDRGLRERERGDGERDKEGIADTHPSAERSYGGAA